MTIEEVLARIDSAPNVATANQIITESVGLISPYGQPHSTPTGIRRAYINMITPGANYRARDHGNPLADYFTQEWLAHHEPTQREHRQLRARLVAHGFNAYQRKLVYEAIANGATETNAIQATHAATHIRREAKRSVREHTNDTRCARCGGNNSRAGWDTICDFCRGN
jgi:hypothetical protein